MDAVLTAFVREPLADYLLEKNPATGTKNLFLGSQSDMDDVARAFEKVYEHRGVLNQP